MFCKNCQCASCIAAKPPTPEGNDQEEVKERCVCCIPRDICLVHRCAGEPRGVSTVCGAPAVVDDYTCGCGNTKCNKTEKSCWKCGAPISNAKGS